MNNMISTTQNQEDIAVPVWIMQKDKAITLFPETTPQQFDLLIIDEASQCDLSGLNLIFKCKKSLIVGDSNQMAVGKSPATIDKTNQLLDEYFPTHPFKTQFDPNNKNNSIYTLSSVIYPNIITLKEHFRCLPEIIGFSNKYVYNNEMIPLKTAIELPFGKPIECHYVADDFMQKAKKNVVDKVVREIIKYIEQYKNQQLKSLPTIGIITLDSSNKEHFKELLKQISTNELIRKYEDSINLLIGTAREFQGNERDVIFLTIGTSHQIDEKSKIMKPPRAVTSEEYMRIYNVAASRAKEKSVLVHSIHPDSISLMRDDCYRKKIIEYYNVFAKTSGTELKSLEELLRQVDVNSGDFERSVCTFLFDNEFGNYLFPQFSVGNYNIDFALIRNNQKIAIECDGQQYHSSTKQIQNDIKRQLILERAGWKFLRIQSIDWFSNQAIIKEEILEWLKGCFG